MFWKVNYYLLVMKATIYKIINDINNKEYVGQTYQTIEKRFDRHCSESRWVNTKKCQ